MNCRRARQKISLYVGGELRGRAVRPLECHLKMCPDCQSVAEELRIALAGFRAAARSADLDWPEAEWKGLMERIRTQPPRQGLMAPGKTLKIAWAYGTLALLLLVLSVFLLKARLFPPASVQPAEILASTEVQPGRSLEFAESQFSRLRQDVPFRVRAERPRTVEPERRVDATAGERALQEMVSMTLVSQETGLKVYWTFNRNFEWKEEEER